MDFAIRADDHNYKLDPIVRSLLDTDFYCLLMQQFIWERYPNDNVIFRVNNRTRSVKLAEIIDIDELKTQLDHCRTLRFTRNEIIWLRGHSFYGQEGIFKQGYLDTLRHFRLPEYEIQKGEDGQYEILFSGPWWQSMMWEMPALTIINELRYRAIMQDMSKSQLDILYARAKVKLYAKMERLAKLPDLNFTDFGTRRRHSFLWQEHCVMTAAEVLGKSMTGTSNVYLAFKHEMEPKGTNAHMLPMGFAALTQAQHPNDEEALRNSQYEILRQWQNAYHGNLLVFLPDTFGTTQFLKNAPQWLSYWKGGRPDSKPAFEAGEELIEYWHKAGFTKDKIAKEKLIIFSDGLDVRLDDNPVHGADIVEIYEHFHGRVGIGFGMGTNLTNDFKKAHPTQPDLMKPISIVCKVDKVNGHPAVKLSDNRGKVTSSDKAMADYYIKVFGDEGVANTEILV